MLVVPSERDLGGCGDARIRRGAVARGADPLRGAAASVGLVIRRIRSRSAAGRQAVGLGRPSPVALGSWVRSVQTFCEAPRVDPKYRKD